MCRLTAYIGPPVLPADLVTRPNRSIITQSFSARERVTERGYLNGDGFGLGWYPALSSDEDPALKLSRAVEPCVFTSTGPAWNNENLARLAKSITSPIVFAHVRAASVGLTVCECSCHPFHYHRYMWMHNGMIGGFKMVRRRLLAQLRDEAFAFAVSKGSSDSALCFALFINELADPRVRCSPDQLRVHLDRVIQVICDAVEAEGVQEPSMLNFVVSDGCSLLATRYIFSPHDESVPPASLYFASGTRYECKDEQEGEYRMIHADRRDNLAIITSEPLTNDATDWVVVPVNHCLVVTHDLHVFLTPINAVKGDAISQSIESLTQHMDQRIRLRCTSTAQSSADTPDIDLAMAEHSLSGHSDTVLALVFHRDLLFSGSQDGTIRVWDPTEYKCVAVLTGHSGSVLSIIIAEDFLFSASSDNSIFKWQTVAPFARLGELHMPQQGDILSLAAHGGFLYAGFQDTCIRRIGIRSFPQACAKSPRTMGRRATAREICAGCCTMTPVARHSHTDTVEIFSGYLSHTHSRTASSHIGYVYALNICGDYLCSAAGDGRVMVWNTLSRECIATLSGHTGSVLALASQDAFTLFSGSRDGTIRAWDLEGFCCKRTMTGHSMDVLSLVVADGILYSGSADGKILTWSCDTLSLLRALSCTPDTVQALTFSSGAFSLIFSGSSDNSVLAWRPAPAQAEEPRAPPPPIFEDEDALPEHSEDVVAIVDALRTFISFESVSGHQQHRASCWKAAKYLARIMRSLTCVDVRLVPCGDDRNPLVYGRIVCPTPAPTVVVYGHYDVQPASESEWRTSPWQLTAMDGYLYGRGVTDNKGPILAILYAVHEAALDGLLNCNVVFLFEGEEEAHSDGFVAALESLVKLPAAETSLKDVSMILVSNNYWLDDGRPCLTYGTRGVINVNVTLAGPSRNLHSGVDGGAIAEPMADLMFLLNSLTDSHGQILIPGFHSDVRPTTASELELFNSIQFDLDEYCKTLDVPHVNSTQARDVLMARWRFPTLSVVSVETTNTDRSFSVIPHTATAKVSIRFVPNQRAERLIHLLRSHLENEFSKRRSPNKLAFEVVHQADWWLGDPHSPIYLSAGRAIKKVWGETPVLVREGGTMPITSFLSRLLDAPALHLPMGQASDSAHLANERIRLANLIHGKDVVKNILFDLFNKAGAA
eukprot:m.27711 g.27711  ORF g.27711 m.27711 type:complete len:1166 (+) comp4449_c0_seq1:65-3562(+)